MQSDDGEARPRAEEPGPVRRPYEPPRLEVLELRPEEQLLLCTRVSHHHCGDGYRKHS